MRSKTEILESCFDQEVKVGTRKLSAKAYNPLKGSQAQTEFLADIRDLLIELSKNGKKKAVIVSGFKEN